jgi:hypothetical protein
LVTSREEDGEDDGHGGEEDVSGSCSKRDSIASSDKSPGQRYCPQYPVSQLETNPIALIQVWLVLVHENDNSSHLGE